MTAGTTRKRKSPGGNQGGIREKNRQAMSFSYPASPVLVKDNVSDCTYLNPPTAKRRAGFCTLTGDGLACPCPFMEVPHADL
jgi:hypothetical protein